MTHKTAEQRAEEFLTNNGMWPEQLSSRINTGGHEKSPTVVDLFATCIREQVEPLEAENARLRALAQVLVDGLHAVASLADVDTDDRATIARDPLSTAKKHGIVPTNTDHK